MNRHSLRYEKAELAKEEIEKGCTEANSAT